MNTYIHTYIRTYREAYRHTYIHTYWHVGIWRAYRPSARGYTHMQMHIQKTHTYTG